MPNGRPGDNPITDLLLYGDHPFPPDIEDLILRLHKLDSSVFDMLEYAPFEWESGRDLDPARILLHGLIESHGNPNERRRLISAYFVATRR